MKSMLLEDTMQTDSFRNSDTTIIEIVELHLNEISLLKDLRKRFRFGEVTIIMKDGLPVRWKRITEFGEPGG